MRPVRRRAAGGRRMVFEKGARAMRYLRISMLAAFVLGVLFVSEVFGYWTDGGRGAYGRPYVRERATMESGVKISWLMGRTVMNLEGQDLGSINEVLIAENGRIKYAILDQGGIVGRGLLGRRISDELYAVPWSMMNAKPTEGKLTLDVSAERLKMAPTVKRGEWTNLDNPEFEGAIHGYYGGEESEETSSATAAREGGILRGAYMASAFMGKYVESNGGEELGRIRDLVSGEGGRIKYVVISNGGGLFGMGGKLVPVPWESMKLNTQGYSATVDMDKARFMGAPSFVGNDWRKFDDPEWTDGINSYFKSRK